MTTSRRPQEPISRRATDGSPHRMRRTEILRRRGALLADLPLELERLARKGVVLRLHEKGIETAAMIHRLERVRRHAQLDRAAERIRDHGDIEQVGQEAPLGLDVRVAHLVPDLRGLAGQFAPPRH